MITCLKVLTVLYLMSFVFVVNLSNTKEKQEMLNFVDIDKNKLKIIFFTFPFLMVFIFIFEMYNVVMFLLFGKIPKPIEMKEK